MFIYEESWDWHKDYMFIYEESWDWHKKYKLSPLLTERCESLYFFMLTVP